MANTAVSSSKASSLAVKYVGYHRIQDKGILRTLKGAGIISRIVGAWVLGEWANCERGSPDQAEARTANEISC